MSPNPNCVLCNQPLNELRQDNDSEIYYCECNTCGRYISASTIDDTKFSGLPPDEKAMISAYTRELSEYNAPPPELHTLDHQNQIEKIIERYKKKSVREKLESLLLFIEKKSGFFRETIDIDFSIDYPISYSKNKAEARNICELGKDHGFLLMTEDTGDYQNVELLWNGYLQVEKIKESGPFSKKCFVAMPCSDELTEIYENGIKRAIEESGYDPIFIEKEEHNEKICDLIIAEIRACKFLIADVTGQRQNVYYEAGYAQGLNRHVIWTCRQNDFNNVHFDTQQYNHIVWEDAEDLKKRLLNRIKATIL